MHRNENFAGKYFFQKGMMVLIGHCCCFRIEPAWSDGGIRLVHFGTVSCEYFYFGGYTNGCTGYFPTEEEFDKGDYEVYWSMLIYYVYHGRVFPLCRNSAFELIQFVAENAPKI